jgi:hypothetical protein
MYSKELVYDLLADSRCLKSDDIDLDVNGMVINRPSDFSRATRIDLLTGNYHYVSPFYEKDKFIIEIEVSKLTHPISPFSLIKYSPLHPITHDYFLLKNIHLHIKLIVICLLAKIIFFRL